MRSGHRPANRCFIRLILSNNSNAFKAIIRVWPTCPRGSYSGSEAFEQKDLSGKDIASSLGIEVEEITDEQEIQKIQQEYQRHTEAVRSQSAEGYDILKTIGNGDTSQGWAGATRITGKDNLPVILHRGAPTPQQWPASCGKSFKRGKPMPITPEEILSVHKKVQENIRKGHVPRLRDETDEQYEARKKQIAKRQAKNKK